MKRILAGLIVASTFFCAFSLWADEAGQIKKADENVDVNPVSPEIWEQLDRKRQRRDQVGDPSLSEVEKNIQKALATPVDLELDENTTFEEMILLIRDRFPGIKIALDEKSGATSGTAVTGEQVHYHGIKLRSALRLLLSEHEMTYAIRNEVLFLMSDEDAKSYSRGGLYPMTDLIVDPIVPESRKSSGEEIEHGPCAWGTREREKTEVRQYNAKKRCRWFRREGFRR